MKKYFFCFLSLLVLSCSGDSEVVENTNDNHVKIQSLTIQDDSVSNGVATFVEKLDFKFEYSGDRLIKVWDIHGNYNEDLIYNSNNLLTDIVITGYQYPGLEEKVPFNVRRKLTYDTNNKLIKSENLIAPNNAKDYKIFEYPSADIIIVKDYAQYSNNVNVLERVSKIYLSNGNVSKVDIARLNPSIFNEGVKYEYDQKINPNSLIDKNRILGLRNYSFNIFILQDYSQISKNNVIKKTSYVLPHQDEYNPTTIEYNYQNNYASKIQYEWPSDVMSSYRVSAIFGY